MIARHVAGDAFGHGQNVLQVGRAVFVGRRADGDELYFGVVDGFCHVGGEAQPAFGHVALDDGLQAGLPDRDDTGLELVDLALVDIHADHGMADFREAGAGDEANVAGAENGEFHCWYFLPLI